MGIRAKFDKYGGRAIVVLRAALEDVAQDDATVLIKDASEVLGYDGLDTVAVEMYLKMMATMRKDSLQITKVIDSLRPVIASARMQQIAALWESLETNQKVD